MARAYCKGRTKTRPKTPAGISICGTFCGTVGYFKATAIRLCKFTEENWSGRRGSNSQLSAWEAELPILYFQYLQNRFGKMCVHALHTVHALPDLRVAGGRLRDGLKTWSKASHSVLRNESGISARGNLVCLRYCQRPVD